MIDERQIGKENDMEINDNKKILERVTTHEYLESILTEDGKIKAEITNRENKSIYYSLNKTLGY